MRNVFLHFLNELDMCKIIKIIFNKIYKKRLCQKRDCLLTLMGQIAFKKHWLPENSYPHYSELSRIWQDVSSLEKDMGQLRCHIEATQDKKQMKLWMVQLQKKDREWFLVRSHLKKHYFQLGQTLINTQNHDDLLQAYLHHYQLLTQEIEKL